MNEPIKAKNLTAQLQYRAAGNPPSTHPNAAISNAFPGLEMDFRNVWRRILEGIQLHEATNFVMVVDETADPQLRVLETGWRLGFICWLRHVRHGSRVIFSGRYRRARCVTSRPWCCGPRL